MKENLQNVLFPKKEMYELTKNGINPLYKNKSKSSCKKLTYNNMQLCNEIEFTTTGFPLLQPYSGTLDFEYIPFPCYRKVSGKGQALHFFTDDYKFEVPIWNKTEMTTYNLSKFDVLFTPDFSC